MKNCGSWLDVWLNGPPPPPPLPSPPALAWRNDNPPGFNATTGITSPPLAAPWSPPPALAFRDGRSVEAETGTAVRLQVRKRERAGG